jgi:aminopeptidase N
MIEKNRNKVFCFSADSARAETMLEVLVKTTETYSDWFGDMKDYKGYTIIEVPEGYGSQADVTSFCLTADYFKNPKENTGIYHELSHIWDVKPLEAEPCRFESEGRAQFLQFLLSQRFDDKSDAISNAVQRYLDNIRKDFTENEGYQSIAVKDYGIADITEYSYTLGMVIFAMFYDLAGEENFNKAIRSYFSAFYQKGATLEDFLNCCKKYAPFNAEKFFNDWIYSTNAVKLIVEGTSYEDLKSLYR